jgi:hypothetical protein
MRKPIYYIIFAFSIFCVIFFFLKQKKVKKSTQHYNRAMVMIASNDIENAVAELKVALSLNPDNSYAFEELLVTAPLINQEARCAYVRNMGYQYASVVDGHISRNNAIESEKTPLCIKGFIYSTNLPVEGLNIRLNIDNSRFWTDPGIVCSNMFTITIPKKEILVTGLAIKVPEETLGLLGYARLDVSDSDILGLKLSSASNVVHVLPSISISKIID